MNFPIADDQTRVKLLKKSEIDAKKESSKRSLLGGLTPKPTDGGGPATAEASRSIAPHLIAANMANPGTGGTSGAPTGTVVNGGLVASASAVPPTQHAEPKVELVEVEQGIYDIYFTCSCCEQYVIRCESIDKTAARPVPSTS